MKYLAALLVLISLNGHGQCRINMLGGPYTNSEFAAALYGHFIQEIESKSGCKIDLMLTDTLKQYYRKILLGQADIFFSGHHSLHSLKLRRFTPILQSPEIMQVYLVAHENNSNTIKSISDLSGKRIIVSGNLSGANLFLEELIQKYSLENKIDKTISDNHVQSAYQYLEGNADALVAFNFIYDRMPDYLKKDDKVLNKSLKEASYILVKTSMPQSLVKHIQNSANKIKQITYTPYVPIGKSAYADRFEVKLRNFEKNMN